MRTDFNNLRKQTTDAANELFDSLANLKSELNSNGNSSYLYLTKEDIIELLEKFNNLAYYINCFNSLYVPNDETIKDLSNVLSVKSFCEDDEEEESGDEK